MNKTGVATAASADAQIFSSEDLARRTVAGKESNWVPRAPMESSKFSSPLRPEKALCEKSWKLADIEKVK
jgi:hypothetical protein